MEQGRPVDYHRTSFSLELILKFDEFALIHMYDSIGNIIEYFGTKIEWPWNPSTNPSENHNDAFGKLSYVF